ncbi:MAG: PilN domain-containing protein [Gemmatirosa sp.]
MIIEVNLLPGRQSSQRSSGPAFGALTDRFRAALADRYLAAAVVMLIGSASAVGAMHVLQTKDAEQLDERQTVAVGDSTRLSSVIKDRKQALAERDSVDRQLAIIAAIDSNRYVWAHVLDEVSQSLPAYTWLTKVNQISAPPAPPAARQAAADSAKKGVTAGAADTAAANAAQCAVKFRLVGQTVDIQALTTFMRDLESSPFVQRVQLAKSEAVIVDGRDVTEFTLDGEFEAPARGLVRTRTTTVPLR